jgi:hypothetical protein
MDSFVIAVSLGPTSEASSVSEVRGQPPRATAQKPHVRNLATREGYLYRRGSFSTPQLRVVAPNSEPEAFVPRTAPPSGQNRVPPGKIGALGVSEREGLMGASDQ